MDNAKRIARNEDEIICYRLTRPRRTTHMRAIIEVDPNGDLVLKEVFSGVILETRDGNAIGVCMRDDTLEINIIPKGSAEPNWWRVDMQEGTVKPMKTSAPVQNPDSGDPQTAGDGGENWSLTDGRR